jgi:hypothetical protein
MIALLEPEKESDGRTMTCDEKWHAVAGKDPKSDGKFYYAVKTTGVYCVPSCPARPALRENVFSTTLRKMRRRQGSDLASGAGQKARAKLPFMKLRWQRHAD